MPFVFKPTSELKQAGFVSVKAERPNHPSRYQARQGGGQPLDGGGGVSGSGGVSQGGVQ